MRTFSAVEAFTLDKNNLKVALNLSLLQRLRVLEARQRLTELTTQVPATALPVKEPRWIPSQRPTIDELEDQAITPLVALISEHIRSSAEKLHAEMV